MAINISWICPVYRSKSDHLLTSSLRPLLTLKRKSSKGCCPYQESYNVFYDTIWKVATSTPSASEPPKPSPYSAKKLQYQQAGSYVQIKELVQLTAWTRKVQDVECSLRTSVQVNHILLGVAETPPSCQTEPDTIYATLNWSQTT